MKLRDFPLPDWHMVAGESRVRTITLRNNETGYTYNLEGAVAVFTVVDFVNFDLDALVSNRKVIIEPDEQGSYCLCKLELKPEDTIGECGKYIYQVNITDQLGHRSSPRGILYISKSA